MTRMGIRAALPALAAAVAVVLLAGCSGGGTGAPSSPSLQPSTSPAPAAGAKLSSGLHELEDGSVQAVGTIEYRDLEGGFWAVTDGPVRGAGKIIAVIANGAELQRQLMRLEGLPAVVTGRLLDGVSVRMAGPEIEATGVAAASGETGPAE